jgi:hypothetical protein
VARWAFDNCGGDPAEFYNRYEFARARFSALKEAEEKALRGTNNSNAQALANATKQLTPEFLSNELRDTMAAIKTRPEGQQLGKSTRGMSDAEIAQAVQELERVDFKTTTAEAYHAWKHRKEVLDQFQPEGAAESFFAGGLTERYFAGGMDVIRNGKVLSVKPMDDDAGTRIIIQRRYVINGDVKVKEVIMMVDRDGKVAILSWGDPKAINPSPLLNEADE